LRATGNGSEIADALDFAYRDELLKVVVCPFVAMLRVHGRRAPGS
jgi:hypothetical protein